MAAHFSETSVKFLVKYECGLNQRLSSVGARRIRVPCESSALMQQKPSGAPQDLVVWSAVAKGMSWNRQKLPTFSSTMCDWEGDERNNTTRTPSPQSDGKKSYIMDKLIFLLMMDEGEDIQLLEFRNRGI
ncbi:hypothetical protein EK904_012012 [Melospiza melodia maxima]|nr:hypothetical protein EK904_012012 [Melospiza melodia maxima]